MYKFLIVIFSGIEPPESWLVGAVDSPYDLDNIYLEEVESGVYADFELEYLLLEGAHLYSYYLVVFHLQHGLFLHLSLSNQT